MTTEARKPEYYISRQTLERLIQKQTDKLAATDNDDTHDEENDLLQALLELRYHLHSV